MEQSTTKIKYDLTEGSILKTILKTSLPMIFAMILQTGFNIVDTIYVGRISAEAIAAVSMGFPLMFLMFAVANSVGTGGTSFVARLVGAKNIKKAGYVVEHALLLGAVISIFFTICGIFTIKPIFSLMGAGELLPLVSDYMFWIYLGSFFMLLSGIMLGLIRGEGDAKNPVIIMVIATIANIILDPIFIFWLDMGVKGAAIATIISNIIAFILALRYLLFDKASMKIELKKFSYDHSIVKEILRVGVVSSLSQVSMAIGLFLLTKLAASFGPLAIASFGIGFRIDSIVILPALGVMLSLMMMVGQNVGAKKFDRAEKLGFGAMILVTCFSLPMGILMYLFARPIVLIFTNNPTVIEYTVQMLKILAFTYVFAGISISVQGVFLGAGKPIPAFIMSMFRVLVIAVPLAYMFSAWHGIIGMWYGVAIATICSGIISFTWFKIGTWKKVKDFKQLT